MRTAVIHTHSLPSTKPRTYFPILSGGRWIDPGLSVRERQVLIAWVRGESKIEVGLQLYLTLGTVNTHITRIRGKYAAVGRPANTKAGLVVRALQDGLVTLEEL